MVCPCCLPSSCGCPGSGCNINITYLGETTVVAFQATDLGQLFSSMFNVNRYADDNLSLAANLRYIGQGLARQEIVQFRGIWAAPCMTTASAFGFTLASWLNARTCPNYEQITEAGYFQNKPVNLIVCYGEQIGATVCNMYTVGIDDGSPCPLPAGQPKTRYTLGLLGSVRSTGGTAAVGFGTFLASKCEQDCNQQIQHVIDNFVFEITVPSSTCEPFKAIIYGLSFSGAAADTDFPVCNDRGLRVGPYVQCLATQGPPVWNVQVGCEITRNEMVRGPLVSDRGTTITQTLSDGQLRERAANGPMIGGIQEPSLCAYNILPRGPNNCPNFSGWSFACDLWTHQTPVVSLVCAP